MKITDHVFTNACRADDVIQVKTWLAEAHIMMDIYDGMLQEAVEKNAVKVLRALIENEPVNTWFWCKEAFGMAIRYGNLDIVKDINRKYGIDVNENDGLFLSFACANGHLDIVKYLIKECGATVSNKNLLAAAVNKHEDVIEYLMEQGCDYFKFLDGSYQPDRMQSAYEFCENTIKKILLKKRDEKKSQKSEQKLQENLENLRQNQGTKTSVKRRPATALKRGR